jgi:hypothetical protein
MPVIGLLSTRSPDESAHLLAAFRRGLAGNGSAEGQNVAIPDGVLALADEVIE